MRSRHTDPAADLRDADPESVARSIVLQRLTASARTRAELQQALARKNVPADAASRVLDRMEQVGLVDDVAYARAFVESRRRRAGWSRRAVTQWLVQRGIDRETVAAATSAITSDDELVTAAEAAGKKWRSSGGVEPGVRARRVAAALARRGYGSDIIRDVLDELREQPDVPAHGTSGAAGSVPDPREELEA